MQVGESGWTSPLPLESNANTEAPEDFNIKPVLIRARIPEWGTVHEITARLELVGNGFERTLVRLHRPLSPRMCLGYVCGTQHACTGAEPPGLASRLLSCVRAWCSALSRPASGLSPWAGLGKGERWCCLSCRTPLMSAEVAL